MKIAIFTETYLPYLNGVVTHIKILREGLINLGHEVLIVTADKDVREHVIEDGVLRCPALELKSIYGYGVSSPLSHTLARMIRAFAPDIVHIQQEFSVGLAGIRASRGLRVPLVYTLHTMYDDYVYYIAPWPLTDTVRHISHQYVRFVARRADIITGPSKKCVDYLQGAGVNRPVQVIPNSVDLETYAEGAVTAEQCVTLRQKLGIPEGAFIGCFCGRIGKEKGIDNLIRLWKDQMDKQSDAYLIIIGNGPCRDELTELADGLGLRDRVIFAGAVPHDDIPPYYAASDAYVTASLSEMYSISMLEAQASGLPVVQYLDPENVDQIKVGINGWLFESSEQFGDILRNLRAMSPEQRAALAASVRESVRERSSDGIARYMLGLYQQAIDNRNNKPHSRLRVDLNRFIGKL